MPDRIQLSRRKGWRLPPGAVVVARGPGRLWGNPWIPGNPGTIALPAAPATYLLPLPMDARSAVNAYEFWLRNEVQWWMHPRQETFTPHGWSMFWREWYAHRAAVLDSLPALRGRDLACWCRSGCPCHADTQLRLANPKEL